MQKLWSKKNKYSSIYNFELNYIEVWKTARTNQRQPVLLNEKNVNRYLNIELNGSDLLKECKKPNLNFYQISKDVNKPTNNSLSLIQKIK